MSGSGDQDAVAAIKKLQQIEQLLIDLAIADTALKNGDEDSYQIPPIYVCMSICDELQDLGPVAKSSIPQLLTLLNRPAVSDDEHLLKLRAAYAHFAITGDPGICLDVALRLLNLVSKERFSEDSPSDHDEVFWLRAWSCDILGEMGATAFRAIERLKRLAGEDRCDLVRESAQRAIEKIGQESSE